MNSITKRLGLALGAALSLLGCAVTNAEEEAVESSEAALVGVDTHLYLRCNATGWGVDDKTRLLSTSDPYTFELPIRVEQTWMTGGGDQCILTETNQRNGWGTLQRFFGSRNGAALVVPNSLPLAQSYSNFSVRYPALGDYRARVNFRSGTISIEAGGGAPERSTWTKTEKVLVLNFDPSTQNGTPVHERYGYRAPNSLAQAYAADMHGASDGAVSYQVVDFQNVNQFPRKVDGFTYTAESYDRCLSDRSTCHVPDSVDYVQIIEDFGICERVESGQIDEVWLFGGPYFGYWESTMAGDGAYWVNSPPVPSPCGKKFIIMGFNYERDVESMLHDFGHRTESILSRVYSSFSSSTETNPWDRFSSFDLIRPGQAGCGNTHFPHNALSDYDYSNPNPKPTECASWENYPAPTMGTSVLDCSAWGCSERGYLMWLFDSMPRNAGTHLGYQNDWWKYLIDHNTFAP